MISGGEWIVSYPARCVWTATSSTCRCSRRAGLGHARRARARGVRRARFRGRTRGGRASAQVGAGGRSASAEVSPDEPVVQGWWARSDLGRPGTIGGMELARRAMLTVRRAFPRFATGRGTFTWPTGCANTCPYRICWPARRASPSPRCATWGWRDGAVLRYRSPPSAARRSSSLLSSASRASLTSGISRRRRRTAVVSRSTVKKAGLIEGSLGHELAPGS